VSNHRLIKFKNLFRKLYANYTISYFLSIFVSCMHLIIQVLFSFQKFLDLIIAVFSFYLSVNVQSRTN